MKSTQIIQNSLRQDNVIRSELIHNISIYCNKHINNVEILKLFNQIDYGYKIGNKKIILDSLGDFIKNEEGKFNNEYGKAKDHLESLIKYNNDMKSNSFKLTSYELFSNFGVSDRTISSLGITRTSKTGMITKFFEFLTAEALKNKYIYIQDVIVYAPGKLQVPFFNGTKQPKFDLLVIIEDFNGNKIHLAFDHKVKELKSCIKDIENHGLKYSVYTLGDVEDQIFYESPAVKQCLLNYDYTEIYKQDSNYIDNKILKSEIASTISNKDIPSNSEITEKVISNLNQYDNNHDINIMLKTPLIPAMLVSSKDLAKTLANLSARNSVCGVNFSNDGFY